MYKNTFGDASWILTILACAIFTVVSITIRKDGFSPNQRNDKKVLNQDITMYVYELSSRRRVTFCQK
jgi:hypothetical protein